MNTLVKGQLQANANVLLIGKRQPGRTWCIKWVNYYRTQFRKGTISIIYEDYDITFKYT